MADILDCCVVYASKIVVIPIFRQIQTITCQSVNGIVRISVEVEKTGVLIYSVADTILSKIVPINRIIVAVTQFYVTKTFIPIAILIEEIPIPFNGVPLALYEAGTVVVTFAVVSRHPGPLHQFAIFKTIGHFGEETTVLTVQPLECHRIKIIVTLLTGFICKTPPSRLCYTLDDVIACAVHIKETGNLALAGTGHFIEPIEILVFLVIQPGNLVDTLQSMVINEVVRDSIDCFPTGPRTIVQNETIRDSLIRFAGEVTAAGMRNVFRFLVWINAILLLEGFLTGHIVKRVCPQVNIIANRAGVRDRDRLVCIPGCAVLHGHLHAAENADGVGCVGRNCLALLDEATFHRQQIVLVERIGC